MTTTQISPNAANNHVAAIVARDGNRLGHVVRRGFKFEATRKAGSDQDVRRFARGFKTAEAAAAWIAESAA